MDFIKLRNALVVLGILVAVIWLAKFIWELAGLFSTAILIFFLAWLVSFALSPVVRRLGRTGLPRMPSTIAVYVTLAVAGILMGLFLMPLVVNDLTRLAGRLGEYGDELQGLADGLFEWLRGLGVPEESLQSAIGDLGGGFSDVGSRVLTGAVGAFAGAATAVLVFVLTLVVSFYLVLDWDRTLARFEDSLPGKWGFELREAVNTIEATFAGFLRAQFLESALYGAAVAITMVVAGLDFAVVVSVFSGLALVVPFVGAAIGILAPILAALLVSPTTALWVGLALLGVQMTLENVVKPRLMGGAVGVHPVVVIAGILAGSTAAGFWGAIFGVPLGALVYIAVRAAFARWVAAKGRSGTGAADAMAPKGSLDKVEAEGSASQDQGGMGPMQPAPTAQDSARQVSP